MTVAYFDCRWGAAGDMLCAALLDAGVSFEAWHERLSTVLVPKGNFSVKTKKVQRSSLACTYLKVDAADQEHHRTLPDIEQIIDISGIPARAKALSREIFLRLADAEAAVHGISREQVHFHEVGAVDSIIDIVGFAIAYDMLDIKQCVVSAVPLGSGAFKAEHGLFFAPGPAVLELLKLAKAPTLSSNIDFECLTPTGAAILVTIADQWGNAPDFSSIVSTGYGAGTRDPEDWPNACRVIIGNSTEQPGQFCLASDTVCVVEANLDDCPPNMIAFAADRLWSAGALDVAITPVTMKKSRSGHVLTAICRIEDARKIEELILVETTSIGVRCHQARRLIAQRHFRELEIAPGQTVRVKVSSDKHGKVLNTQPEHEDVAALAKAWNIPLKEAWAKVLSRCYGD